MNKRYNQIDPGSFGLYVFFILCFGTAVLIGWVLNIIKLVGIAQATDPNYVMAALRAIGIFVAPLGAVLGYFV